MKKYLSVLLAIVMVLSISVSLTGCGEDTDVDKSNANKVTAETAALVPFALIKN